MQAFISFLKKTQLVRVFSVLFASIFLFSSVILLGATAQANVVNPSSEGYYNSGVSHTKLSDRDLRPSGKGFFSAKALSNDKSQGGFYKSQGGMNQYSDVDPRMDTTSADQKAAAMVNRAEKNLEKRADSVDQYVENYRSGAPLGERTRKLGEDLKAGAEKTQENAENLGKGLGRNYNQATEELKDGVPQVTQQASNNAKNTAKGLADDAKDSLRRTAND